MADPKDPDFNKIIEQLELENSAPESIRALNEGTVYEAAHNAAPTIVRATDTEDARTMSSSNSFTDESSKLAGMDTNMGNSWGSLKDYLHQHELDVLAQDDGHYGFSLMAQYQRHFAMLAGFKKWGGVSNPDDDDKKVAFRTKGSDYIQRQLMDMAYLNWQINQINIQIQRVEAKINQLETEIAELKAKNERTQEEYETLKDKERRGEPLSQEERLRLEELKEDRARELKLEQELADKKDEVENLYDDRDDLEAIKQQTEQANQWHNTAGAAYTAKGFESNIERQALQTERITTTIEIDGIQADVFVVQRGDEYFASTPHGEMLVALEDIQDQIADPNRTFISETELSRFKSEYAETPEQRLARVEAELAESRSIIKNIEFEMEMLDIELSYLDYDLEDLTYLGFSEGDSIYDNALRDYQELSARYDQYHVLLEEQQNLAHYNETQIKYMFDEDINHAYELFDYGFLTLAELKAALPQDLVEAYEAVVPSEELEATLRAYAMEQEWSEERLTILLDQISEAQGNVIEAEAALINAEDAHDAAHNELDESTITVTVDGQEQIIYVDPGNGPNGTDRFYWKTDGTNEQSIIDQGVIAQIEAQLAEGKVFANENDQSAQAVEDALRDVSVMRERLQEARDALEELKTLENNLVDIESRIAQHHSALDSDDLVSIEERKYLEGELNRLTETRSNMLDRISGVDRQSLEIAASLGENATAEEIESAFQGNTEALNYFSGVLESTYSVMEFMNNKINYWFLGLPEIKVTPQGIMACSDTCAPISSLLEKLEEDRTVLQESVQELPTETNSTETLFSHEDLLLLRPEYKAELVDLASKVMDQVEQGKIDAENLAEILKDAPEHIRRQIENKLEERGIKINDPNNIYETLVAPKNETVVTARNETTTPTVIDPNSPGPRQPVADVNPDNVPHAEFTPIVGTDEHMGIEQEDSCLCSTWDSHKGETHNPDAAPTHTHEHTPSEPAQAPAVPAV